MKKLTIIFLILLGATAYIHAQDQFKKIFIPDMYQMGKHIYSGTKPRYESNQGNYTNMKLAGITHLFGLADQTPLSNISNTGSNLKILDRRVSENKPGTNQPYEAGLYMFGLGVSPEDHPYRVGGQEAANLEEDDDLWGFGKNNKKSTWALDSVGGQALVGTIDEDDNQQSYRTCPANVNGNMAAIKNDPDHFLLHTTGGPHLTINDPIRYYIGITGSLANDDNLRDDDIVLELHVYTTIYPAPAVDAGRDFESSTSDPSDTCAATAIYIKKSHLAGSGWQHHVSLDSYIRHVENNDEKPRIFHIRANKVGNCVVNIRDIFIVDQYYYASVYPNDFREDVRNQIASSIENDLIPDALKSSAAYEGIYLEEPKTLMNRSIRIVDSIAYREQQRNVAAMDWHRYRSQWEMMRFDWPRKSLDVDGYFLTDSVSNVSNNNSNSIQEAINARIKIVHPHRNTYHGLRANIEAANGYGRLPRIPYINYIQIGEERHYVNDTDRYTNRTVSSQEIQMQGWLSLCFGAKGIGYYPGAEREDTYYDDNGWLQGVKWQGMFKSNSSGTEMIIDTDRYNAVKKLNAEIDSIAPVYMQLIWKNSYNTIESGSAQPEYTSLINETPIASCTTRNVLNNIADPGNLRFAQVAFFDHESETGPNTYFIVMNRRVLAMESRYITLTFDNLNTAFSTNYSNWKITDVKKDTSYTIPASGGVYTFFCRPGEGKLFKLEPVVKSGYGRIKYNETINEVLTVPSGKTLVIASEPYVSNSITLNFGNAGRFISNGALIINGSGLDSVSIVFDPSSKATYNTGIRLNSGSAVINCAKISNASYGVRVMNNARLTMYGSRLYNNLAGVLFDGNAYAQTRASTINDCFLHNNEQGVHFYNGAGRLKMNRIMQNYEGVLANTGSYGYLHWTDGAGSNKITQSDEEGVLVHGNSTLIIGDDNSEYNYNTLDFNTFDIAVYNNSTVHAAYVWWGDAIPNRVLVADPTSILIEDPYLMSEPPDAAITDPIGNDPSNFSDGSVTRTTNLQATDDINTKMGFEPVISNTLIEGANLNKLLNDAKKYFRTGNYFAGAEICKSIIDSNKNDKTSVRALSLLADESREEHGSEFRSYISQLVRIPGTTKIDNYVGLIDAKLDTKNYESKIDSLIAKYNKKDELLMYLYDKFVHCLLNKEKPDQAIAVYAEMAQRFPKSKLTQIAYRMLNPNQFSVSQNLMSTENTQVPKEYGISNNYPNPFNPETSIDYAIPYPSNVVIELYGVTGEKVRTLVQNDHTPGYYTYRLTNISGMASGIYFYRIAATNLQTGKVYTTVRKMTLMK